MSVTKVQCGIRFALSLISPNYPHLEQGWKGDRWWASKRVNHCSLLIRNIKIFQNIIVRSHYPVQVFCERVCLYTVLAHSEEAKPLTEKIPRIRVWYSFELYNAYTSLIVLYLEEGRIVKINSSRCVSVKRSEINNNWRPFDWRLQQTASFMHADICLLCDVDKIIKRFNYMIFLGFTIPLSNESEWGQPRLYWCLWLYYYEQMK